MQFIEHIIEPHKLLLTWQSADTSCRTRFVVAELSRSDEAITLTYLNHSKDFQEAIKKGFSVYPAFQNTELTHHNVLDAFMRRLPPRSRGDFDQYLEGLRLKPSSILSDFALLGYSGARLPSDGFAIIHPFQDVEGPCEFLLEATGFRQIHANYDFLKVGDPVTFMAEYNEEVGEDAIRIESGNQLIGYVTRALIPTFQYWLEQNRVIDARIEKMTGAPERPTVYLFVKVEGQKL